MLAVLGMVTWVYDISLPLSSQTSTTCPTGSGCAVARSRMLMSKPAIGLTTDCRSMGAETVVGAVENRRHPTSLGQSVGLDDSRFRRE